MAQLKDLLVNGVSRFIGDVFANKVQLTSLEAPTTDGGSTYGQTNGKILRAGSSSIYWGGLAAADIPNLDASKITSGTLPVARGGTGQTSIANIQAGKDGDGNTISSTYLKKSGGTMTGALTLSGAPTSDLHAATKKYVDDAFAANDAMIFKGTISGGSTDNYGALTGAANRGWTYKVNTAGKINGVAVEIGDILICLDDNTAAATSSDYATAQTHWVVVQNNVDGAVFKSSNSFTDGKVIIADGTNGKVKASSYSLGATINSGTANQVAYYSDANTINSMAPAWQPWTAGSTNGPQANIQIGNAIYQSAAIPSATATDSGIVTTVAQTFAGDKTFQGNVLPQTSNTYDFGDTSHRWQNIYLKSGTINYMMPRDTSASVSVITIKNTSDESIASFGFHNTGNQHDDAQGAIYLIPHYQGLGSDTAYGGKHGLYIGTTTFKWENKYILRYSETATGGQVIISDGTTGNVKTSGYTIGASIGTGTAQYGIAYYSTTTNITSTAQGTNGALLTGKGANAPAWKASANGAVYATSANGDLQWGTLPIAQGGTGNTSYTANRLIYSESTSKLSASGHYASSTKIAVNSTSEPSYNLYVNGNAKIESSPAADTPLVTFISNTTPGTGGYQHGLHYLVPNMVPDSNAALYFGKAASAGNAACLQINWAGNNSNNNFLGLGFYSVNNLVRIYRNGSLSIGAENNNYKLYVNGTGYISSNLTVDGSIYFGENTSGTTGKPVLAYNASNTAFGITYYQGTPDVMTFSASGNANNKTNADFSINGLGDGILSNRGNRIPHTGNTTGTVGSATKPVYVNAGKITQCSYGLEATVNDGTATRIAYYSGANAISAGSIVTNGDYLGSVSYLTINSTHQTNYRMFVSGSQKINSGSLQIYPVGGSYNDGIRIHARSSDNSWSALMLCGDDNTGDTGTSAKSWFFGNNKGTLYINVNGSNTAQNGRAMATSTGWTFGNTTTNTYALNAATFICDSWVRTKGSTGWYNEDYAGGWYMADTKWIRTHSHKPVYIDCADNNQYGLGTHQLNLGLSGTHHASIMLRGGTAMYGFAVNNNGNWYFGKRTSNSMESTTNDVYILSGNGESILPYTTDTVVLGNSSHYFKNAFIGTGGDIHIANLSFLSTQHGSSVVLGGNKGIFNLVNRYYIGNKTYGIQPSAITLEYTTNGNAASPTWTTNSSVSDANKLKLFADSNYNITVGNATYDAGSGNTATINAGYGLRITVDLSVEKRTGWISMFAMGVYCRTHTCKLTIERYNTANATWTTVHTWEGNNSNDIMSIYPSSSTYMQGAGTSTNTTYANKLRFTYVVTTKGSGHRYAPVISFVKSYGAGNIGMTYDATTKSSCGAGWIALGTSAYLPMYADPQAINGYIIEVDGSLVPRHHTDNTAVTTTNVNNIGTASRKWANIYGTNVYGAVWNDYAEFRATKGKIEPGRCIKENGDDTLELATKRLERGCEIVSDTYGFAIGETEKCRTPIASSGRVLAYGYEPREEFASHIGWPVCSGPNGTVSIMTEEEEEKYPSRIIGTISAVPDYEEWGTGNVKVNGRVWIRIR